MELATEKTITVKAAVKDYACARFRTRKTSKSGHDFGFLFCKSNVKNEICFRMRCACDSDGESTMLFQLYLGMQKVSDSQSPATRCFEVSTVQSSIITVKGLVW